MEKIAKIRMAKEREYKLVPIEMIKVINSRSRNQGQFEENIRSIRDVGLLKPIMVNKRFLQETGFYELVFGEGRLLAYKALNYSHIEAEVIDCSREEALIMSLVENIARARPNTMWFAREIKRLHDSGFSVEKISNIVGKSPSYIQDYITLVKQGEERLIRGIESGLFPMSFAQKVARSKDAQVQNILMDAFDEGIINSGNLMAVKRVIEARKSYGKAHDNGKNSKPLKDYTVDHLKRDITKTTSEKTKFIEEAERRQNRLFILIDGLNTLWRDEAFLSLLYQEKLDQRPELKGHYDINF